jgi:hypothetical protein
LKGEFTVGDTILVDANDEGITFNRRLAEVAAQVAAEVAPVVEAVSAA